MAPRVIVVGVGALALTVGLSLAYDERGSSARQQPHSSSEVQPPRVLPLQGGRNFRELGGYRTLDGRTVQWGVLFRSGSMHGLTPADYTYLEKRGIRVVCDFRDNSERAAEPVNWPKSGAPKILADDYLMDKGLVTPTSVMAQWTPAQARAAMASNYPRLLAQYNGQYRRLFQELLARHVPLAFNCTAGKDRTGIAAALILTALGVPRETIIQDYLLTNRVLDPAKLLASPSQRTPGGGWDSVPPEVRRLFVIVERGYIEAALHVIDTHPGGIDGYLRDEMGLSQADLIRLRDLYLQS